MLKQSKREFYRDYFQRHARDVKKTWSGIKNLLHANKKTKSFPSKLVDHTNSNTPSKQPIHIATAFNSFFSTIGKSLDDKIQNSRHDFKHCTPAMLQNSIFITPTSPAEIATIINSLDVSKACGPFSLPPHILKMSVNYIAQPLSHIINASFEQGIYPESLKTANVIPIHKTGSLNYCKNYRPISLLSNIGKIFEKCMFERLTNFINNNNILYTKQFGFRRGHSTSHALVSITEWIKSYIDRGYFVGGLFLDIQKAFDTVNHGILLQKLNIYGIRGICLQWIDSYMRDRKQFVSVDGEISDHLNISHGVPQGSILGPLLFLLYINDFNQSTKSSTTIHFADDTTVLFYDRSIRKLKKSMTSESNCLFDWFCANRLSMSADKTELILFQSRRKKTTFA